VFECHRHAVWPRLIVMDGQHCCLRILSIERGLPYESVQTFEQVRSARPVHRSSSVTIASGAAAAVDSETTQTCVRQYLATGCGQSKHVIQLAISLSEVIAEPRNRIIRRRSKSSLSAPLSVSPARSHGCSVRSAIRR
jgi:hypothetical protein